MRKPMYSMYSITAPNNTNKIEKNKTISRQIGGMKAQGSTSISVDIGGTDSILPKMEYVELLEIQVKELRERIAKLEKQLITTNNRIQKVSNNITMMNMSRR